MLRAGTESTPSTLNQHPGTVWTTNSSATLPFILLPPPAMKLTFLPRPPISASKKRSRAVADIDGEHSCVQKKKRRLRLFLITSRLSPQFSHPASNIVDRGSSKIAVWAKQKALGRNLLPKAAILNGIRRRNILMRDSSGPSARVSIVQEKEKAQLELARLEFTHGSVDTYTHPVLLQHPSVPPSAAIRTGNRFVMSGSPNSSPSSSRSPSPTSHGSPTSGPNETASFRSPNEAWVMTSPPTKGHSLHRDYHPLPPSPLGVSNYDAFDAEEDEVDLYAHLDDEGPLPSPFDEEDDEVVPFSPSAVTTNVSATILTSTAHATSMYSDYTMPDYGHVDTDANSSWLNTYPTSHSTSKRTDSFATSPNFRPCIPKKSISPEMYAVTPTMSVSPNFAPSTPTSANSTPMATSPNFVSTMAPPVMFAEFPSLAAGNSTTNFPPSLTSPHPSWAKKVSSTEE